MFKALYNHVNNIIEKYLQIYDHILIYLQWIKKEIAHIFTMDKKGNSPFGLRPNGLLTQSPFGLKE